MFKVIVPLDEIPFCNAVPFAAYKVYGPTPTLVRTALPLQLQAEALGATFNDCARQFHVVNSKKTKLAKRKVMRAVERF